MRACSEMHGNETGAGERQPAAAALKIHRLIKQEDEEKRQCKRMSGIVGGLLLGTFFSYFAIHFVISHSVPFDSLLVVASFAVLPFAFSTYFALNYRYAMWQCLAVGTAAVLLISAIFAV